MSEHAAEVIWSRGEQPFLDNRYSRAHTWRFDGGLEIPASSSPQVVPLPWSDARAVDPEEAFVASLSSCHMLWFLALAAEAGLLVERYEDSAAGVMARDAEGRLAMSEVLLRPRVTFAGANRPDAQQLAELHERAHQQCFIANSVKSSLRCIPVPA